MKKLYVLLLGVVLLSCFIISGCQKILEDPGPGTKTPEDSTGNPQIEYVTANVIGRILDDNDNLVSGATIKTDSATTTSNASGEFSLTNVALNETMGLVKAEKAGYFSTSRSFPVTPGATHYATLQLAPRNQAGTFSGSNGGNITIDDYYGASVSFPAAAIVNATGNTAYTGTVTVYGYYIPASSGYRYMMPGPLRGIHSVNNNLQTYGMMVVELRGANDEVLQLAQGKQATIKIPILSSLQSTAPATTPLSYYKDSTGLWEVDGSATKNGDFYEASVSHFSFWNCDRPLQDLRIKATFKDQNNVPLARGRIQSTYFNDSGEVVFTMALNETRTINVYNLCGTLVHTQTIGPFTTHTDLGTITVASSGTTPVTITGTILNCTGNPVTDGYVNINVNNSRNYTAAVTNGSYSITAYKCPSATSTSIRITGVDFATMNSVQKDTTFTVNAVNMAPLTTCNPGNPDHIRLTIGGAKYDIRYPPHVMHAFENEFESFTTINNEEENEVPPLSFEARFEGKNTGTFPVSYLSFIQNFRYYKQAGSMVSNITEYGSWSVGYIGGTITGYVLDNWENIAYPLQCNFRIRHQ